MSQLKKLFLVAYLLSAILFITKVCSLDPSTVSPATKQTWCSDQQATCRNICLNSNNNDPITNYCIADTLQYDCVCSDGTRPNSTEYTQTIPYFTCTADQQTCINNCQPTTQQCVNDCTKVPCAATVVKTPSQVPGSVSGGGGSPASPNQTATSTSTATATQAKNAATLISSGTAAMISPVESGFMLFLTLVVLLFARINT